jgi:hypothetical protein
MNELFIIPCGTIVIIKLAHIEGIITCVAIRFDNIQYEITYYLGGEQHCIWAREPEFELAKNVKKIKIGLRNEIQS